MLNFINYNLIVWLIVENIWYGRIPLWLVLWPLSLIYVLITWAIRFGFQIGLLKSWRSPCPIIVVGNITIGGNGKTPIVIWLVEKLKQQGLHIGVISRGYGGKTKHYPLLVTTETSSVQAGDEPILIFQRTNVAVAVAHKRRLAIEALLNVYNDLDIIITDDGLQHYGMQRDFEIVVVDGIRRFGNGWCLPAGPMRESISRLHTVDAVIINEGDVQGAEIAMTLQPGLAVNLLTGETMPLNSLPPAVAIAGIGHPRRFFNTLKKCGVNLVAEISFPDHYSYNRIELIKLTNSTQCLLITEKDAVKCKGFAQSNWWYLPVDAHLNNTQAITLLNNIIKLCVINNHTATCDKVKYIKY